MHHMNNDDNMDAEAAQLTGAAVWRKAAADEDEEDTMQGPVASASGASKQRAAAAAPVPGIASDDETLHASDVKRNLRGRTSGAGK